MLLVISGVTVTRLQRSFDDVTVEKFDFYEVASALETTPGSVREAAIIAIEADEVADATEEVTDVDEPLNLQPVALPDTQNQATLSPPLPDDMFETYLLLGTDLGGYRADVVIMLLLPSDGAEPILVSLPRDLYLENPCTERYARLNSGMNGCGADVSGAVLMATSVEMFTGIKPDHFIVSDFDGFREVVDAVGGVEICFEFPVNTGRSFEAGCQVLSGADALSWVRSRKTKYLVDGVWSSLGSSDFSRQDHQREFLFALASEVAEFPSISRFSKVVRIMAPSLTISDSLSLTDLVVVGWSNRYIEPSDVLTVTISTKSFRTKAGALVELPTERFNDTLAGVYPAAYREVIESNE